MNITANTDKKLAELERENFKLKEENQRLQNAAIGKKNPVHDDVLDGIVATILILSAVAGAVLWLSGLPTS